MIEPTARPTLPPNATVSFHGDTASRMGRPIQGLVYFGGQPICDDRFDSRDAQVVCRMAGWYDAARYQTNLYVNRTDFSLDDLRCHGDETSLLQCRHRGLNRHNCGRWEGVFVECCPRGECLEPQRPTGQPTRRPRPPTTRRRPQPTRGPAIGNGVQINGIYRLQPKYEECPEGSAITDQSDCNRAAARFLGHPTTSRRLEEERRLPFGCTLMGARHFGTVVFVTSTHGHYDPSEEMEERAFCHQPLKDEIVGPVAPESRKSDGGDLASVKSDEQIEEQSKPLFDANVENDLIEELAKIFEG